MALAPVLYTLWQNFLRYDPANPIWSNRDRFVLSVGHASTLLYSVLHLAGVKSVNPAYEILGTAAVSLDDLKAFRQLDSKCPGHPEYRWTAGVECTTGPLGTGVATSVGMAMAGLWQAATFNRPGYTLFDYDVYALAGDGCMMEGDLGRGRVVGRPSAAVESVLDLRQQQDHHRRLHRSCVHRRRRHPIRRLRLGRPARRRRQRRRRPECRLRRVPGRDGQAHVDHRVERHRLRRPDARPATTPPTASRSGSTSSAARSGSTASTRTRPSSCPNRSQNGSPRPPAPVAPSSRSHGMRLFAAYRDELP